MFKVKMVNFRNIYIYIRHAGEHGFLNWDFVNSYEITEQASTENQEHLHLNN